MESIVLNLLEKPSGEQKWSPRKWQYGKWYFSAQTSKQNIQDKEKAEEKSSKMDFSESRFKMLFQANFHSISFLSGKGLSIFLILSASKSFDALGIEFKQKT